MKLRATSAVSGDWRRRLRDIAATLAGPAADAAAQALAETLARDAPSAISVSRIGLRRAVGTSDADAVNREIGTLEKTPQPWLAPSLPPARGPMRAAVHARVRDIVAAHAGRGAAARAISRARTGKN